MLPSSNHIQEVCKLALLVLFCSLPLQFCGGKYPPVTQTLTFDDESVSFQNSSCPTQITLVNSATVQYSLAFLTATFTDENGDTFTVQLDQNEVADSFDSVTLSAGGITHGNVVFDLQNANLSPPLTASVVIVGLTGSQVTHFVGDFTCQ